MRRTVRSRAPFLVALALIGLALVGPTAARASGGAGSIPAPTAAPAGPVLTAVAVAPGAIAVTGTGFTPGGRVYLALYDAWGTPRHETRWIVAGPTAEYQDGSADHAAGFVIGGTFAQGFDHLCGDTALVRAYDQGTFAYTPWIEVDLAAFRGARL
jgi:hypothetical protein